jgi:hypothetical protein
MDGLILGLGLPDAAGKEQDDPGAGPAAQDRPVMPVDAVHSGDGVRRRDERGHGKNLQIE